MAEEKIDLGPVIGDRWAPAVTNLHMLHSVFDGPALGGKGQGTNRSGHHFTHVAACNYVAQSNHGGSCIQVAAQGGNRPSLKPLECAVAIDRPLHVQGISKLGHGASGAPSKSLDLLVAQDRDFAHEVSVQYLILKIENIVVGGCRTTDQRLSQATHRIDH